ncbi:hypothetical protein [Mucilaginibacter sp.]|uniref:hypothetical protein n=1 Tax=Mucilaginibacter sp. TaxID=1882438 RepID=UPI0035BC640B
MRSWCVLSFFLFALISCKHKEDPQAAFYYWKTIYQTNSVQKDLLNKTGNNKLYLRFFDVTWDEHKHDVKPNAVVHINESLTGLRVIPVIFISNRVFERIAFSGADSLAKKCHDLVSILAAKANCSVQSVQIDCDWTESTKEKYFSFLKFFKAFSRHSVQATIRLHQVKYRERTGVPPVDKGVLMFYNMGKITAGGTASSIYNEKDAARYLSRLGSYPLPLDVALPLFSWVIQSRDGKLIQIYSKITCNELKDQRYFGALKDGFRAKKSLFLKGVYIKANDNFKPEKTNADILKKAADQLSDQLPSLKNRTIIYYELANINLPEFTSETLNKVTNSF